MLPGTQENPDALLPWDTFGIAGNRHNVRVLCDLAGLSLEANTPVVLANGTTKLFIPKDIICGCVEVESDFQSYFLPPDKRAGQPVSHPNYVVKNGEKVLSSTDWGIVQINDTPEWYIGAGLAFESVDFVLANPQACIEFMVKMFQEGQMGKWVSYSSGEFRQYLPA